MIKSDGKESVLLFLYKNYNTLLSLIKMLGEKCVGVCVGAEGRGRGKGGVQRSLKWMKCLNMWVMLLWGHSLIMIKWDWGKFFPKVGKWLTPTFRNQKVTYCSSSLWIEGKCAIDLIPVKSYKGGLVFLVAKILKDITNHSIKAAKVFSQKPIRFKANASLYSNVSQYSGAIKFVRNLSLP